MKGLLAAIFKPHLCFPKNYVNGKNENGLP